MPGGRPSKYEDLDLEKVKFLIAKGATDPEMAKMFDVAESTWYLWKTKHPEFSEILKDWKASADAKIERSLHERAMGYTVKETKTTSNSKNEDVVTQEIVKEVPPDTAAAIFWLKNRKRDLWRDKVDHSHSGEDGGPIQIAFTNTDEEVL